MKSRKKIFGLNYLQENECVVRGGKAKLDNGTCSETNAWTSGLGMPPGNDPDCERD